MLNAASPEDLDRLGNGSNAEAVERSGDGVPLPYEEGDLDFDSGSSERQVVSSRLHAELIGQRCPERRAAIVRDALHRIGFEWMTYVTMTLRPTGIAPVTYLATYANRDWASEYFDNGLWSADRRHALVGRSTVPLLWSLETLVDACDVGCEDAGRTARIVASMDAHGVRCGIFCVLPTSSTTEYAIVSLSASDPSCDRIDDAVLGQAMILATSVHEVVGAATPRRVAATESVGALSATQRRVLKRLCDGHGDKRIAADLGMTTHNVDYHLRALRRRFGARNRVQLAQMATVHLSDPAVAGNDAEFDDA